VLSMDVKGELGKFGYTELPEDIVDSILMAAIDKAYLVAKQKAPYDTDPLQRDPRHIRDEIKKYFSKMDHGGRVWVSLPWAPPAEYGTKSRLMHPYFRPASAEARKLIKSIARSAIRKAVNARKTRTDK
jgi:hypothetical protein